MPQTTQIVGFDINEINQFPQRTPMATLSYHGTDASSILPEIYYPKTYTTTD